MIELYRHQKVALSYLRSNDSFALFMEQGTGKTIPSLFRVLDLAKSGKIDNALIVAPKSALGAWDRDMEKFSELDSEILKSVITLINYDKVWRGKENSPFNKVWDCIILDEAHLIKNRTSERSKFLLKLSITAKYRYILTGTPIGNGQLDNIYSEYTFLDPYLEHGRVASNIFKGTYTDFTTRYCIMGKYYKPIKYVNVRELQNIINKYSYRVTKSECLDLPEKLPDEIYSIELKEKALYKKLQKESALLDYDVLAENPLARLTKLRQLASGYITTEDGIVEVKNEKIEVLKEFIDNYDKKLVIFSEFKYSIQKITELLKKLKIKYVTLDGDQKDKTIWRKFQAEDSIRVIVCQYQSASSGIDLFSSDTIIYYEPTLRSTTLEQSRDRIHRTGQTNKCSYIHFITKGTVEESIYKALSGYSDFSEQLFTEYLNSYTRTYNQ
jgi:SNF2 family DNA or RNA helicase